MEKAKYEAWINKQEYRPVDECMTMKEAVSSIRIHNTHDETLEQLHGVEDAEKLLYDVETENYCPIPIGNGFKCPNCGSFVESGQGVCREESCEIEFIWR